MGQMSLSLPLVFLTATALFVLLFCGRRKADEPFRAPAATGLGLLATFFLLLLMPREDGATYAFSRFLLGDPVGHLVAVVTVLAGLVTVWVLGPYLRKVGEEHAEHYALLVFCIAGMLVMVMTDHLVTFFIGLETMSLSLYILSGSLRKRSHSIEAGMKYLLTGAFASGILLFGLALVYGATGALSLPEIAAALEGTETGLLALTGMLFLLVGFGFKLALVPFHQWAPDVYEGAPTPLTGFMSTTVKLVGFATLLRVVVAFQSLGDPLTSALTWLAALTMTAGNVAALSQSSVKRMLAYSSVSHAGYVLLGAVVIVAGGVATQAVLFYLVTYTLMNLGAFAVLSAIETREGRGHTFEDLGGLRFRHPWLAACMFLFMLSLAGVPPTGGFLAKWGIFTALVDHLDALGTAGTILIVLLAVNSVIGLAYYLRVIVAMYMRPAPDPVPLFPHPARMTLLAVVLCAFLTLWLGFGPDIFGIGAEGLLSWVRDVAAG